MQDDLLSKLDKVKLVGTNKWTACCPVHDDNSPSLSITVKDGKLLCYCFACGAKGIDVALSVGLPAQSLFSDTLSSDSRQNYQRERLLAEKASDELFLRIYQKAESEGKYIQLSDKKRYKQAINRLESINAML